MRSPRISCNASLSDRQIETFIRDGHVIVPRLFPQSLAERITPIVWSELDLDPEEPSSWRQARIILEKVIESPPASEILNPEYRGAIDDLCGRGRWRTTEGAGYFPVVFPGFAEGYWRVPAQGWHVDGVLDHNRLGIVSYGLIGLELLTPTEPGGGGTAVRVGSHNDTVRILRQAGVAGISELDLEEAATEASKHRRVVEITGEPGDVVFMHPYSVHASSANTGSRVRILGHRPVWVHDEMNFKAIDQPLSPVEQAVVNAV